MNNILDVVTGARALNSEEDWWSEHEKRKPDIAIDSLGNINVVWEDKVNTPDLFDIIFTTSENNFADNVLVNTKFDNNAMQKQPVVAVDANDRVYIAWTEWKNDIDGQYLEDGGKDRVNNCDIYVAIEQDDGNFREFGPINDDYGKNIQWKPDIAFDGSDNVGNEQLQRIKLWYRG